jgi:hypothetical protein
MPLMRTTSSRRPSKRTLKKRTNPKHKYTNIFKRLTKKQYYNISVTGLAGLQHQGLKASIIENLKL